MEICLFCWLDLVIINELNIGVLLVGSRVRFDVHQLEVVREVVDTQENVFALFAFKQWPVRNFNLLLGFDFWTWKVLKKQ